MYIGLSSDGNEFEPAAVGEFEPAAVGESPVRKKCASTPERRANWIRSRV